MLQTNASRWLLVGLLALLPWLPRPAVAGETIELSSDLRVAVRRGRDVELELRIRATDDYHSIAERIATSAREAEALRAWNGDRDLVPDAWLRVPLALLTDSYRSLVLRNLFADDGYRDGAWLHRAQAGQIPTYDEGLWQVAQWFTGDGERFHELMRENGLSSPELRSGQEIRIPEALLLPAFRARSQSDDGMLEYDTDAQGPHAVYRLQSGEALYSAVAVRFTGRTGSDDVRAVSELVSRRSGIDDTHDIPVRFEVKIPLDLLEPQFLPPQHPRRLEAEAQRAELERELERQPIPGTHGGLEDVLVILDPGHGGRDLGTMNNGIWEHDYVYDVACRLKQKLERRTAARVSLTLVDRETGCLPSKQDRLEANRQGTIQTTPPFLAREEGEAAIGVNLRWYLANSIYRKALDDGVDADRVVFLSLHADARHPSLRGLMVYVPGANYRTKTYGRSSGAYNKFREVREKPHIRFSKKSRVRSEAVSRKLAAAIVGAFRDEKIPVQPYQPIRDKVIRGKGRWIPAVLRGNAVPSKVLVEMVNLSNPDDAALLAKASRRDDLAEALLASLYRAFGEEPAETLASTRTAR